MGTIFPVHPVVVGMRIVTKITGMIYNSAQRSSAPPSIVLAGLSQRYLVILNIVSTPTSLTSIDPVWKLKYSSRECAVYSSVHLDPMVHFNITTW